MDKDIIKPHELSPWLFELSRLGLQCEACLIIDSLDQEMLQILYEKWRDKRLNKNCDEVYSLPLRFADLRSADPAVAVEAAAGALRAVKRSVPHM